MPDIADVTIRLRADTGDVLAQLAKLDQAVKDAGQSAGELTGGAQKLGQGLDALKGAIAGTTGSADQYNQAMASMREQGLSQAEATRALNEGFQSQTTAEGSAAEALGHLSSVELQATEQSGNLASAQETITAGLASLVDGFKSGDLEVAEFIAGTKALNDSAAILAPTFQGLGLAEKEATENSQKFSFAAQDVISRQNEMNAAVERARSVVAELQQGYEAGTAKADALARAELELRSAVEAANAPMAAVATSMKGLGDAAQAVVDKQAALDRAVTESRDAVEKLKVAYDNDQVSASALARAQEQLKAAIEAANVPLKQYGDAAQAVVDKQNQLNQAVENARAGLAELKAANEAGAMSADVIKRAENELKSAIDAAKVASDEQVGALKRFTDASGSLMQAGASITAAITVPIVGIGTAAFESATKLDEAMDMIRARTGETGASLEGLQSTFRTVFANVPEDAKVVADAISTIHDKTGLTGAALEDFSGKIINLGHMMGESIPQMAQAATKAFNEWGISGDQVSKKLDEVMRAAQASGAPVNTLLEELKQYGPPLKELGIGFDQALSMMGNLEKEGVPVQQAFAGLRKELGLLAKAGIDPNEAFQVLIDQIKNTKSETEGLALAMQVFGQRAGPAMFDAIRSGKLDFEAFSNAVKNGHDTITQATADTRSWAENWQLFKNQLTLVLEPLGVTLVQAATNALNAVKPLLETIQNAAEWFGKLPAPAQEAVLGIAGIAAAIGPLVVAAGGLGFAIQGITGALATLGLTSTTTAAAEIAEGEAATAQAAAHLSANAAMADSAVAAGGLKGAIESLSISSGAGGLAGVLSITLVAATTAAIAGFHDLDAAMAHTKETYALFDDMFQKFIKNMVDSAKTSEDVAKAQDKIKEALSNGLIAQDQAAKALAILDEKQKAVIGADWAKYKSETGLAFDIVVTGADKATGAVKKTALSFDDISNALGKGTAGLKEYDGALTKATHTLASVDPAVAALAFQVDLAEKNQKKHNEALAELSVRLGRIATDLDLDNDRFEKATLKVAAFIDEHLKAVDSLKAINSAATEAGAQIKHTADTLEEVAKVDLTPVQKAMADLKVKVDGAHQSVGDLAKEFDALATDPNVSMQVIQEAWDHLQSKFKDMSAKDIPAVKQAWDDYIGDLQNSGASVGQILGEQEREYQILIDKIKDAAGNSTEYQIKLQEIQRDHENVRNSAGVWDDIRVKLDAAKTSVGQLKQEIAEDFAKAYDGVFKGFAKGLADLAVDGGSFTDTMGKIFKSWEKKAAEDFLQTFIKPVEDAIAGALQKLATMAGIGQQKPGSSGPLGIPIPGTGTGRGTTIPGVPIPGSKAGPTGTLSDPTYVAITQQPIHVLVDNAGAIGSGGGGGGGFPTGQVITGAEQAGQVLVKYGLPKLASTGAAAGTAAAYAAPFAIPAYFAATSLLGDPGAWKDPSAFAESLFRWSKGNIGQYEDPAVQSSLHGMFGGNLTGGVPGPQDTSYWGAVIAELKRLNETTANGLGDISKNTAVTASPEEKAAAIKVLTDNITSLKADQANLQDGIVKAIAAKDFTGAAVLEGALTTVNQNLSAAEDLLSQIQGNTGDTADAMSGVVATAEQSAGALKQAQASVDALKAQEADLQNRIIIAVNNGDMATATRLAGELNKVDGQLQTANGFLDLIKSATSLTASQQELIVQATAKAFGPDSLKPLIDTIDRLRAEQTDLQTKLAAAVAAGDTELAASLSKQLDTVNGSLNTAVGQFSDMNAAVQAQSGQSAEVVAATKAMEEALKTGDIKAISDAANQLNQALNAQPDLFAKASSDLMAAIMTGNTAEITAALGELQTALDSQSSNSEEIVAATKAMGEALRSGDIKAISDAANQLQTAMEQQPDAIAKAESDLMSAIMTGNAKEITAALGNLQTAIAANAKEETARQTSAKLDALQGMAASIDEQTAALKNTKDAVDALKGQQWQLSQDLIIARAHGDKDLIAAIETQLGIINGDLNTAQSSYDQLLALIPSQVDRIVNTMSDVASNLERVATQEAGTLGLPGDFTASDLAKITIPSDPAKIMDGINMSTGMITHFIDAINNFDQVAIDKAVAEGDPKNEKIAKDQLARDQESLKNWRLLLGLLTVAMAATGNLSQAQLDATKKSVQDQITDSTNQQTFYSKMLALTADPALRAIIQSHLSQIDSDLRTEHGLLDTLNNTNLDGTQKIVDAVSQSGTKTPGASGAGSGTGSGSGSSGTGTTPTDDISKKQQRITDLNAQIGDLPQQMLAAQQSGNFNLAYLISTKLQPLEFALHDAANALFTAQSQQQAFKETYGTPSTVADFDKIIASIKPQLQYAIDNGNKSLIDQINAQLTALQAQRDAVAAGAASTTGAVKDGSAATSGAVKGGASSTSGAVKDGTAGTTAQVKALDDIITATQGALTAAVVSGNQAQITALTGALSALRIERDALIGAPASPTTGIPSAVTQNAVPSTSDPATKAATQQTAANTGTADGLLIAVNQRLEASTQQIEATKSALYAATVSGNQSAVNALNQVLAVQTAQQQSLISQRDSLQASSVATQSTASSTSATSDKLTIVNSQLDMAKSAIDSTKEALARAVENGDQTAASGLTRLLAVQVQQQQDLQEQHDSLAATASNTYDSTTQLNVVNANLAVNTNAIDATKDQLSKAITSGDQASVDALNLQLAVQMQQRDDLVAQRDAIKTGTAAAQATATNTGSSGALAKSLSEVNEAIDQTKIKLSSAITAGDAEQATKLQAQLSALGAVKTEIQQSATDTRGALTALPALIAAALSGANEALASALLGIAAAIAAIQPSITNNNYYSSSNYSTVMSTPITAANTSPAAAAANGSSTEENRDTSTVGGGSGARGGRGFEIGGYDPTGGPAILHPKEYVFTAEETSALVSALSIKPLSRLHEKLDFSALTGSVRPPGLTANLLDLTGKSGGSIPSAALLSETVANLDKLASSPVQQSFAVGGLVPYDMKAMVHEGELIIPRALTANILELAGKSGASIPPGVSAHASGWTLSPQEISAAMNVGGSAPRSLSPSLAQQISQDSSAHSNLSLGPIYIQGANKSSRQLAEEIYQELPKVAKLRTPRAAHKSQ